MIARTTTLLALLLLALSVMQGSAFRPLHFGGRSGGAFPPMMRMPSLFSDPFSAAAFPSHPAASPFFAHRHQPSFLRLERLLAELLQEEERLAAYYNKVQGVEAAPVESPALLEQQQVEQQQQQQQQQQRELLLEQQRREELLRREQQLREQQLREQQLREQQQQQRALYERRVQEERARQQQARQQQVEQQRMERQMMQKQWEERQQRMREQQLKEQQERLFREEQLRAQLLNARTQQQQQQRTTEMGEGEVEYVSRGPFRKQVVQRRAAPLPAAAEPAVPKGYERDEEGNLWQAGGIWVGEKAEEVEQQQQQQQREYVRAQSEHDEAMDMIRMFLERSNN